MSGYACPHRARGGPGTFVATPAGKPHNSHPKSGTGRFMTIFSPGGYEHFFMDWEARVCHRAPTSARRRPVFALGRSS